MINRRVFLQSLFASTAAIVVASADVLEALPPPPGDPRRTYVDIGRRSGLVWLDPLEVLLGAAPDGSIYPAIDDWYIDHQRRYDGPKQASGLGAGTYVRLQSRWLRLEDQSYLSLNHSLPYLAQT